MKIDPSQISDLGISNTTDFLRRDGTWAVPSAGGGGSGTVTSVAVTSANGVSGTVATPTTTPNITLTLGAITPTSVTATGSITGANLSGTNTGDQFTSVPASSFLGQSSGGSGPAIIMNTTTATGLLNPFTTTAKGLVPAPGSSTGRFLKDDGTWATSGSGGHIAANPLDFGCVGNGTTDDTANMLTALQSGNIIDGLGKTYALSDGLIPTGFVGLRNCKFVWISTTAMNLQKYMLTIIDQSNWFVDQVQFYLGDQRYTGSTDDSSRGGFKCYSSTTNNNDYLEQIYITRCKVWGNGNGTGIRVQNAAKAYVHGNMIFDREVFANSDGSINAPNDIQNGLHMDCCIDSTISNNIIHNLNSEWNGNMTNRFSRGITSSSVWDSTYTGNVISIVDQGMDFSGGPDRKVTGDKLGCNKGLTVVGNSSSDVMTYGFKFANCAQDIQVSGNVSRHWGDSGFVFSGLTHPEDGNTYSTQRINVSNNYAIDPQPNALGGCIAFRVLTQANAGYPRDMRFVNNTAWTTVGGMEYGFHSDVPQGNGNRWLINNVSGATTAAFGGTITSGTDWITL